MLKIFILLYVFIIVFLEIRYELFFSIILQNIKRGIVLSILDIMNMIHVFNDFIKIQI